MVHSTFGGSRRRQVQGLSGLTSPILQVLCYCQGHQRPGWNPGRRLSQRFWTRVLVFRHTNILIAQMSSFGSSHSSRTSFFHQSSSDSSSLSDAEYVLSLSIGTSSFASFWKASVGLILRRNVPEVFGYRCDLAKVKNRSIVWGGSYLKCVNLAGLCTNITPSALANPSSEGQSIVHIVGAGVLYRGSFGLGWLVAVQSWAHVEARA